MTAPGTATTARSRRSTGPSYDGARIAPPPGHAPLPTLYWSERVGSWWPNVARYCTRTCRGLLYADPPGVVTTGPGVVACIVCPRIVAYVAVRRVVLDPLPPEGAPRRGRPPASAVPPCTAEACARPGPAGGDCSMCVTRRSRARGHRPDGEIAS